MKIHLVASAIVLVALVAPTLTMPVDATGAVAPTIYGSTLVQAGRTWSYSGQLVVDGAGAGMPLYGQTIGMYMDGVRVAEAETDLQGKYLVRVFLPRGTHILQARAFEGSATESASDPLSVYAYPTWPNGPVLLRVDPGFYYTEAKLPWLYPTTDGGYPVTSYRIDRSMNGGPFSTVFTGLAYTYDDANITPGATYVYHGYATTDYGTSNKTTGTYVANDTVALVDIDAYKVCDAAGCAYLADGGTFTTTSEANVTVQVNVSGIVDTYPVSPPGVAGRAVHGRVTMPTAGANFSATSGATGLWSATVPGYATQAPASGCATLDVVAHARPDNQGRSEDVGSLRICV